jgi:AcrR family transcriptional regulator
MNVGHKEQPATTGWDRRRVDTRLRILDAAERLASESGVEALTMQRLGQQLGYQAGALYRYFPSKEALLSALLVRTLDAVSAVVAAAAAASKGVVERARRPVPAATQALLPLVLAARGYLRLSRAQPAQMALLVRALAAPLPVVDDAAAQGLAEQTLKLMGEVAALLHAAETARALAPGEGLQRVALLWAGLQGLVGNPKLLRFELPGLNVEALVDAFVRTLLLGWGAKLRVLDDTFERAARAGAVAT